MSQAVAAAARTDDLHVDLRGKTALVTGAATGIGRAIALRFGASGANVVIDHRNQPDEAGAVVAEIERGGGTAIAVSADITDEAAVDALVARAVNRFRSLDVLVNNAGIEENHLLVDTPLAVWERIQRVNLTGSFLCARAAARAMIARGRGGRIINISSVHEDVAFPGNAAYAASKGGIRMFMRTIALELAPHGITVNDVAPGAIATPINAAVRDDAEQQKELLAEIPLGRVGDPGEIAALCTYLASDAAGYVTGSTFVIDGGLTRFTKGL
ncbi:MAG TPA: glucose 1-dehydrogenase [Candidatus Elarobacter sp.]|jgi:glucose 1-dehydrogenase|nr:glucose 1-dehydrogenase [Candidatus Elarobacter sp.]